MDPNMYRAVMESKRANLNQYSADQFSLQVTPNSNTALHVAADFGSYHCVPAILSKCPSLLRRVNNNGDTPLHVAMARRYFVVIKLLINFTKSEQGGGAVAVREMLRARNLDGDTPLHLAARYDILGIVLEEFFSKEDPWLDHGPNEAGETPLYLYVERGYDDVEVLSQMLKTCTPPEYGGPNGRTALHAAVIRHKYLSENSGRLRGDLDELSEKTIDTLIEWKKDLIKEPDAYGQTPLHYAADNGDVKAVQMLLDKDKSVAYVTANNNEGNTALHMATAKGDTEVMKEILSKCPDCWEMVNSKGRNILHVSTDLERDEATEYISKQPWVYGLVNRKDHEGNTPMHVLAHKGKQKLFLLLHGDTKALNNEGLTPYDILLRKIRGQSWLQRKRFRRELVEKDQRKPPERVRPRAGEDQKGKRADQKDSETLKPVDTLMRETEKQKAAEDTAGKMADTHMIVATLISTISFAASFTIPGGYHGDQGPNQGMAILVREAAFKAFVITNAIAVICSTSSVFLYVSASLFGIMGHEGERRANRYAIAFGLIITAMLAMMIAFITGAYAILAHSLGLAIVTCVMACSSLIGCAFELTKHFAEEIAYVMRLLRFHYDRCICSVCKVARLKERQFRRGA